MMGLDQKWLAGGQAVLVLDAGSGEPLNDRGDANPDYRPALVAVLATEYHEPAQVLDADPLAPVDDAAGGLGRDSGATRPGGYPGEVSGPLTPPPAPQAVPGPATPDTSTRSTAAEDPHVTAPGSAAATGYVSAASIVATIRDLERRSDAGDADAQAELAELQAAFEDDDAGDAPATGDRTAFEAAAAEDLTPGAERVQADTPETSSGGNGEAPGSGQAGPAAATGAGEGPAAA